MIQETEVNRTKQIFAGAGILTVLTLLVTGTLLGWRHVPGLAGEWLGTVIGIMTTPFFLEGSFLILGLVTVVTLNGWKRQREGDEFVYLEEVTGPEVPADLPDNAKWAVYKEMPLDAEEPSLAERTEGAIAIADYDAAAEWLAMMERAELVKPGILKLRIELAQATNRPELAEELEREFRELHGEGNQAI